MEPLRVEGKCLRVGSAPVFLRLATYGPFPGGLGSRPAGELERIRACGFDALRLYEWPTPALLDAAAAAGLRVFAGLEWPQAVDFLARGELEPARQKLVRSLAADGSHPALAGVFVANEVPADLARWMGPANVREAIESLIETGRRHAPHLIWCYGNYPSTEYLEPANADVTAMNVYLEDEAAFRAYLRRLHHVAGDRPVILSEFGLDSRRGGAARQAEAFGWAIRAAREEGLAGFTAYAWSDRWLNAGEEVLDWDFGLVDRQEREKPALAEVRAAFEEAPASPPMPAFSVIVCTRDGRERMAACLGSLARLSPAAHEVIVVDDGSTDGTADLVAADFPWVRLVRLEPSGLSAARNAGAAAATGEVLAFTDDDCRADPAWLGELARTFARGWDAAGGPNLPPPPADAVEAVIAAAPGAASHVMLDDAEAEHVPGCNLAVRRTAYFAIGGFDARFRTAGDDVDFCWRLRDAGFRIGFAPNAFVWHHRRATPRGYLRQQAGYGRAEAMLRRKHPARFSPSGDAIWHGVIYNGAAVRAERDAVIYHGPMGTAGYQSVVTRMQPLRPLDPRFSTPASRALLAALTWLAPRVRGWHRIRRFRGPLRLPKPVRAPADDEFAVPCAGDRETLLSRLIERGWEPGGPTDGFDLERGGTRVLIAFERGAGVVKRALLRVWGPAAGLREDVSGIGLESAAAESQTEA